MSLRLKNRFVASSIHLLISASVFTVLTLILIKLWYPTPYFTASGGWQGIKIVALIDIVLGPLLTLIIFNARKKFYELAFDLSVIASLQIAALVWGAITIYDQRPVAAVFWYDGFYTVPAKVLDAQDYDLEKLKQLDSHTPAIIYAKPPETLEEQVEILHFTDEKNIPPHHQPNLFRPYTEYTDTIFANGVDIEEIISVNSEMKAEIDDILAASNTTLEDNHYLSLVSRYRNIILIFDKSANLLGTASAPYKD